MRNEILNVYKSFEESDLNVFFDRIIETMVHNKSIFSQYLSSEFFERAIQYRSKDFIIGHSDDLFDLGITFYINNIDSFSEEQFVRQITNLIWSLSAYMLDKVCRSCGQSNVRLLTCTHSENIYEFCEECLFTTLNEEVVTIDEELFPAKKNEVVFYLKSA